MTPLESVILSNKDTATFSQLHEKIQQSTLLTETDRKLFDDLWKAASDFENWRQYDLILGCKITQQRLREESKFDDESIAVMVRFASYDWR